ncbi:MAG: tryptophan synthase subunit alpha [Planctomycetota bacterium]|nr:tryptophan synthase subunit alpha [Planctomycetota bacterium]MCX8040147.1 tryptophan synthase subunit alpha [Planctomycetota bacterium]MDW8373395.1 tryptophan synthase subunit alpha [Planctomycetota bacterium]
MTAPGSGNRIARRLADNRAQGRRSFIAYLTAGDPDLPTTIELACALDAAGVDVLELGIPFSDPMADGVAIQASHGRALAAGTTPRAVIDAVRRIRERSQLPLLLFTYLNPVLAYGVDAFAGAAAQAGADGVLLLDLPPEEDPSLLERFLAHGLATVCLAAPTTPSRRARFLAQRTRGFLYYICRLGVTGERDQLPPDLPEKVAALKQAADIPVCIGFGISTPEQAATAARFGDGVVVGSHLVRLIEQHGREPGLVRLVAERAAQLAGAVHAVQ